MIIRAALACFSRLEQPYIAPPHALSIGGAISRWRFSCGPFWALRPAQEPQEPQEPLGLPQEAGAEEPQVPLGLLQAGEEEQLHPSFAVENSRNHPTLSR